MIFNKSYSIEYFKIFAYFSEYETFKDDIILQA